MGRPALRWGAVWSPPGGALDAPSPWLPGGSGQFELIPALWVFTIVGNCVSSRSTAGRVVNGGEVWIADVVERVDGVAALSAPRAA